MAWTFYEKGGVVVTPRSVTSVPTGSIIMSPLPYTAAEPEGYLFCNGQTVPKNNYINLFAAIGDFFGPYDVNNFTLPDLRGRMLRGIVSSVSGFGYISGVGGQKTHSHTLTDHQHSVVFSHGHTMPSHTHAFVNHTHSMASHNHYPGTLSISTTTNTWSDLDAIEPQPPSGGTLTALPNHRHGTNLSGEVGGVSSGGTSTSSGSGTSGPASVSTLSNYVLNALSPQSGAGGTTTESNIPPYFTCSFLIKT